MDFIWTIALLVGGYFVYNWYTGLQQKVKAGPDPDPRIEGTQGQEPAETDNVDYTDYEEVND